MPTQLENNDILAQIEQCLDTLDGPKKTVVAAIDSQTDSKLGTQMTASRDTQQYVSMGGDAAVLSALLAILPGLVDDMVEAQLVGVAEIAEDTAEAISDLESDLEEVKADAAAITAADRAAVSSGEFKKLGVYLQRASANVQKSKTNIRKDTVFNRTLVESASAELLNAIHELEIPSPTGILALMNKLEDVRAGNTKVHRLLYKGIAEADKVLQSNVYDAAASLLDATPAMLNILDKSGKNIDKVYTFVARKLAKASSAGKAAKKLVALQDTQNIKDALDDALARYADYINPGKGTLLSRSRGGVLLSTVLTNVAKHYDITPANTSARVNLVMAKAYKAIWSAQSTLNDVIDEAIDALGLVYTKVNRVVDTINNFAPTVRRSVSVISDMAGGDFSSAIEVAGDFLSVGKAKGLDPKGDVVAIKKAFTFMEESPASNVASQLGPVIGVADNDISSFLSQKSSASLSNAATLIRKA